MSELANGKQWRDITAARIALLEPEKTAERLAMAEAMMRAGKKDAEIRDATKAKFGMAAGGSSLQRIRAKLKREETAKRRTATRRANKAARKTEVESPPAPKTAAPHWVRLDADPAVAASLIQAGLPFVFDGERISFKAGV